MKITLEQGALLRELSMLQGIIEKKGTIPILSNVLLTATEDGRLNILATDLEVGFRSSVEAEVKQPGATAVHARRLHDIVKQLPPGSIEFRQDGGSLHLQCERIKYRLASQDVDQFPTFRSREGGPVALIAADQLADMIKRVLFAVTSDDPRYTLGGALWELSGDVLTMVATDGHRLCLTRRTGQNVAKKEVRSVVVPRKALGELQRLAADHDGDTYFWITDNSLFAQFGERELWTNLQEQRFPDYKRVIPAGNDKIFDIATTTFRDALQRVAVLSLEHTHLIKLELSTDQMRLSAVHQQLGEAQEDVPVQYSGEGIMAGFNAQYLVDFLSVAGTERVRVSLGREMGQALFEPVRPADDNREDRYVVMPMALS
jgi:DNA polymerase III subunit beta